MESERERPARVLAAQGSQVLRPGIRLVIDQPIITGEEVGPEQLSFEESMAGVGRLYKHMYLVQGHAMGRAFNSIGTHLHRQIEAQIEGVRTFTLALDENIQAMTPELPEPGKPADRRPKKKKPQVEPFYIQVERRRRR